MNNLIRLLILISLKRYISITSFNK